MPAKKVKPTKDQTITIRLEPEDLKKIDEIAELVSQKSGVDVTKSWALREAFRLGYANMKKKYEAM